MSKQAITTTNAPQAIGPYSQAIRIGQTIYLSGQIPLDPNTMSLVSEDIQQQCEQVLQNLENVCRAAGCSLDAICKLTIFLTDLNHFAVINDLMQHRFNKPYPARSTIQVSALPKGAKIEIEAIINL